MIEAMSLGCMPKVEASGEAKVGKGKVNLSGNAYPQAREAFAAVLREREGGASQLFRSKASSAAAMANSRAPSARSDRSLWGMGRGARHGGRGGAVLQFAPAPRLGLGKDQFCRK